MQSQRVLLISAVQSSKKDYYLNGDAVILVPHTAVVYPHVAARHVEAVGVEGGEVDDVVVVLLRPPRTGDTIHVRGPRLQICHIYLHT